MKTTPEHPPQGHTTFYRFFTTGFFAGITLAAFFVAQESGKEWITSAPQGIPSNPHVRISPSNAELQALLADVKNERVILDAGAKHKLGAARRPVKAKNQNRLPANAL